MEGSGQEPALRTTLQLLSELSICSPDASAQVQDARAQLNRLLQELKGLVPEKDLEFCRLVSQAVELSSQASKAAALTNQEVWEKAQGTLTCSQWYFNPRCPPRTIDPSQDRMNYSRPDP
jgi:HAUS augmin-like complex subunit 8